MSAPKHPAADNSPTLQELVDQRAASLGKSREEYVETLFTWDTTLRIDQAIAAISIIWIPLWLLLIALPFTPQGKELLAHMNYNIPAARYFIGWVAIFGLFATFISTAMIGVWHFPYLTEWEGGWAPPRERAVIRKSALPPILIIIALPLAILSLSALRPLTFHPLTFRWETFWEITVAWTVSGAVVWIGIYLASWCVPFIALVARWVLIAYGFFGLIVVAAYPTLWPRVSATEIVVVVAATLWLSILAGFVFAFFVGRHPRKSEFRPSNPWVPEFALRHKFLTVALLCYVAAIVIAGNFIPAGPRYMTAADGETTLSKDTRPGIRLSEALAEFKARQQAVRPTMVLVTAAGGGIRAAYWSGTVLAELQDRKSDFNRYVFAISAVSGGALGASTYKAMTLRQSAECAGARGFRPCTDQFLSGDFIGPNVVGAITGDLLDLLMQGHFGFYGRDSALREAWSERWLSVFGPKGNGFGGAFQDMFAQGPTPALLLNGTSAESGNRVITSNLNVADFTPHAEERAEKAEGCIVDREIVNPAKYLKLSVSSAVLTSARFPYVTPPGLLRLEPEPHLRCRNWEKVVDGGYIDNEGIITMRDLLNGIVDEVGREASAAPLSEGDSPTEAFKKWEKIVNGGYLENKNVVSFHDLLNNAVDAIDRKASGTLNGRAQSADAFKNAYRLIVIRLSADSSPIKLANKSLEPGADGLNQAFSVAMNESAAAGRDLVRDFRQLVTGPLGGCWFELNALDDDAPLGWTLSATSRLHLNAWLDGPSSPGWKKIHADLTQDDIRTIEAYAAREQLQAKLEEIVRLVGGTGELACPSRP